MVYINRIRYPYLVALNDDIFTAGVPAVLVNRYTISKIRDTLETTCPDTDSCIKKIHTLWGDHTLTLITDFNPTIKCGDGLSESATVTEKRKKCSECFFAGKCTDVFMTNFIGKNLLPEKYKDKQR